MPAFMLSPPHFGLCRVLLACLQEMLEQKFARGVGSWFVVSAPSMLAANLWLSVGETPESLCSYKTVKNRHHNLNKSFPAQDVLFINTFHYDLIIS